MNIDTLETKIENLRLKCDLRKSQVKALAREARHNALISDSDYAGVIHILNDRDQCAEDALDELSVSIRH